MPNAPAFIPNQLVKDEFDIHIAVIVDLADKLIDLKGAYCNGELEENKAAAYNEADNIMAMAKAYLAHIRTHHVAASQA